MLLTSYSYNVNPKGFCAIAPERMPVKGDIKIIKSPVYKIKFYRPRKDKVVIVDHYQFKDFAEFETFMQTQFSKYLKNHF